MRLDRQFAAGLFASLIAFLALPFFLPGFTLFGLTLLGTLLTQIIVWVIAWVFLNLTYMGGGHRK